jgi:hypothetical protein
MAQEFRLSTAIKLPDDEFERAATMTECGRFKAALVELAATHKLTATVTHETVTLRGPKAAAAAAPAIPVPAVDAAAVDAATLAEIGTAVETAAQEPPKAPAPVAPLLGRHTRQHGGPTSGPASGEAA